MKEKIILLAFLLVVSISSYGQDKKKQAPGQAKKNAGVVELAKILVKEGTTEKQVLEISDRVQKEFVEKQPGYIKREFVKKSETEYLDIVYWESREAGDNALQKAMKDPVCQQFFAIMLPVENGVEYYQVLSSFSKQGK